MRTCDICYEESPEKDFRGLSCKHEFCKDCLSDFLMTNIKDGNVLKIPCMHAGCTETYEDDDVRKFGSKEIYEKYLHFKLNINVDLNPNLMWCPNPECNRYIEKGGRFQKTKTCECGQTICLKCGLLNHPGQKCGGIDQEFLDWKKSNKCKFCPKCGIPSYKFDGCNHMTCAKCKFEYCWICLQPYIGGSSHWRSYSK